MLQILGKFGFFVVDVVWIRNFVLDLQNYMVFSVYINLIDVVIVIDLLELIVNFQVKLIFVDV